MLSSKDAESAASEQNPNENESTGLNKIIPHRCGVFYWKTSLDLSGTLPYELYLTVAYEDRPLAASNIYVQAPGTVSKKIKGILKTITFTMRYRQSK